MLPLASTCVLITGLRWDGDGRGSVAGSAPAVQEEEALQSAIEAELLLRVGRPPEGDDFGGEEG